MDLRPHVRTRADLQDAKTLTVQERFFYQPFRIADDLKVGGGYQFSIADPALGWSIGLSMGASGNAFPGRH